MNCITSFAYNSPDGEVARVRVLRVHDGGGVTVEVELASGSQGAAHEHPGGEELVVMSGRLVVDDVELAPGDYLYTPPGRSHAARAVTDTRFVLVLPSIPVYG